MASYRQVLKEAQKKLEDANVYSEAAQVLLLELANTNSADLYRDYDEEIPEEILEKFKAGVERLSTGEPLAYILGYQWFYGRKFKVGKDVLIPRCETEELVANILIDIDTYFPRGKIKVADIGTGCGEIGITIELEEPRVKMIGSDISLEALKVAKENARLLKAQVEYFQGDMLEPLIEKKVKLDILISDPPYIPRQQKIDASVKDYEPHVALFGGEDGLYFYRKLLSNAKKVLNERSFMAFEIGYDQKEALLNLANEYFPESKKEVLKDIEGKDRMLFIYQNLE